MKVSATTTPAMTVTLRTMTSSVDGVDEGRAVFAGLIALHLRKRDRRPLA
jgi:hypothetical protein